MLSKTVLLVLSVLAQIYPQLWGSLGIVCIISMTEKNKIH